ncbi:uncharacterized protein TNCV_3308411 [Trichonephila clavipes]|nr:uncharacterized protein TNCV_3308411 [Trichonephila clavipes]
MLSSRPGAIYQQDNARPHAARLSQQCLQGYDVPPWPARSPDLSPIEHVWNAEKATAAVPRYRRINCADAKTMAGSSTEDPHLQCNGTRLSIKRLILNVIEATILNGQVTGNDTNIPKIPVIASDVPFQVKRLQFPISPRFAMSINKAQALPILGLHLRNRSFSSHTILY